MALKPIGETDYRTGFPVQADSRDAFVQGTALMDSSGNEYNSSNPISVNQTVQASSTDRSGTITAGGTAQQLMPANTSRRGFWIQNQSTGDLYINGLATAIIGQPSLKIASGQLYETPVTHVNTGAVSIIGAATGQAFAAREW